MVDKALAEIEHSAASREMKDHLLTITLTLATLALGGPDHQEWLRKRFAMYQDLIRDTEIYQMIIQEGVQQQKQKEIQDLQQLILHGFQTRFPELAVLANQRIEPITDLDALNKLALDLIATSSLDQARALLHDLERSEPEESALDAFAHIKREQQ